MNNSDEVLEACNRDIQVGAASRPVAPLRYAFQCEDDGVHMVQTPGKAAHQYLANGGELNGAPFLIAAARSGHLCTDAVASIPGPRLRRGRFDCPLV